MARKKDSNVHEIKFTTKEHSVELCKDGRRLKKKKHWDTSSKAFFILCIFLMVTLAAYTVLESISRAKGRNILDLDYGSVSVQPLEGEKYTPMSDYTAVDVFARINWTFAHQEKWYSEMHGTVDTVIKQNVSTYKKFNNGILISADLTNSSLISNASEFCYLRDQDIVMWRKAAGGASTYNGFDTPWQEGDPYRKMTISGADGFKATNGLPAYELSVYVIEEHTVQSATPIVRGEDGLYTVTYTLVPNTWEEEDGGGNLITKGATAYYSNQMIFSGGLPEPPSFHSISYTLVFDEDWQVHRTDITENYDAKYGPIAANCVYTATTVYEYGTERAESSEFEDYFQNYADAPIDNNAPAEKVPTAANCLAEAFGKVLAEPTTLNVDLSFGGNTYNGIVDLDMSKTDISSIDLAKIEAKLKIGPLQAWLKEGDAYLNYGGAKLKVNINELIDLLGEYLKDESAEDPDLLAALGDGTFTYTDKTAELHSTLPLGDFSLPVNFYFLLDGETVSLDKVTADISLKETELHLQITYGEEKLPDLPDPEKEGYAPLVPYAKRLIDLFSAETLRARISYQKDDLKLKGDLLVKLDPISAKGNLLVTYGGQTKRVSVSYLEKMLYLELDGIKLSASLDEATQLLQKYVDLPAGEKVELDIGEILGNVLSEEFASLIQTTKGESDLTVSLKGSELLEAFGVDFSLGDVTLGVSDEGLSARLLGIEALISEGEEFEIDTQGYTSVLKYVDGLITLFQNDALQVTVDYATGDLKAHADITVDIKDLTAAGKIKLGYRSAEKTFDVLFAEGVVYVCADGIKVSANVKALSELLSDKISIPETDLDARAIVEKILSLDLGRVASISGQSDTLTVALNGTLLLQELGLDFDLGEITLEVTGETVKAHALGANIKITKGESFDLDTDGYIEIVGYAKDLIELFKDGYLNATVKYDGKLSVEGTVDLDINTPKVQADLTLTYKNITKNLKVMYIDGEVYLSVEGLKVKANVEEAVELVKEFVEIPSTDVNSTELLEKLLGANFGELLELKESNGALEVTIHGTKLLEILGLNFELGDVDLEVSESGLNAKALGADIQITKGSNFELDTDGYIEIVGYAKNLIELFKDGYLNATVKYDGKLSVSGNIQLDINTPKVQADLKLTYKSITKNLKVMYIDGEVYLSVEGLKVKANVEEAVELVKEFVEIPSTDVNSTELLEKLLGADFGELLELGEKDNTLEVTVDGTKLLGILGLDFELGDVDLEVSENSLNAKALDAEINITKGSAFELDTNDYIEIVGYAKNLIDLFETGYLKADINYSGELSVSGNIQLDINTPKLQAELTLTYKNITKTLHVMYVDKEVYLSVEGLKVKANVEEAVELVKEFVKIPENDTDSTELLEKLLGANFEELLALNEKDNTLEVTLHGTKLLEILGLNFELGDVNLEVSENSLNAKALGADIQITKGSNFELDTKDYIEIVGYAKNLIELFKDGYLNAEIKYDGELSVEGTLKLDINTPKVLADLTLTYNSIEKQLHVMYENGEVYLEVEGLKVKANVEEAVELVKEFIDIPSTDVNSSELLEKLLGANFEELLALNEKDNTLEVTVDGTKLLEILGLNFELGDVNLEVSENGLNAKALGADIQITKGDSFDLDTENYIEIVGYAKNLIELFKDGYLNATVKYDGELKVEGTLKLDINTPKVQADLTLTYKNITKNLHVMYENGEVYLEVEGLKVKANVEKAVELVKEFVEIPSTDVNSTELLEKLLGANFGELLELKESNGALEVTIHGTKLLEILGLNFELGDVNLEVSDKGLKANALDAEINVTKGKEFALETENYIEIVGYAKNLIELFKDGYLNATVKYDGELSVSGNIQLDINTPKVQADLTLKYNNIKKQLHVMYENGEVYLSVEGLKVKANVEDAVELVKEFVEIPENDTDSTELLEKLLGADFEELLALNEKDNTLEVTLHGTKLLEILGLDFELGDVNLEVSDKGLKANALDAEINVTKGKDFTLDTENYIEIVGYAKNLIELFKDGYLNATVNYNGDFTLSGEIALALKPLSAKGTLTLGYRGASKEIKFFMTENTVYVNLDGLKCSLKIEEVAALFGGEEKTEKPDPKELIVKILSIDLNKLLTLSEKENALELLLDGNEILKAIGVDFDLGKVALSVTETGLEVNALDANIALAKGEAFTISDEEKAGYIELSSYIKYIKELVESNEFAVDVNYSKDKISVSGNLQISVEKLKNLLAEKQEVNVQTLLKSISAKGDLTISSGAAAKKVSLLLSEGTVYLNVDGIKVSLQIEELLKIFAKEESKETKSGSFDLSQILGMDFGKYLTVSEKDGELTLLIKGTELLEYFGKQFALGEVTLGISQEGITLSALDIKAEIAKGTAFTISDEDKAGYIELSSYIKNIKELVESNDFTVDVNYSNDKIKVSGTLQLSVEKLKKLLAEEQEVNVETLLKSISAKGELTISSGAAAKKVSLLLSDGTVYLNVDGIKVSLQIEELMKIFAKEESKDDTKSESFDLAKILNLDFGEYLTLSENGGELTLLIKGTELLEYFGKQFALGEVTLGISQEGITLSALDIKAEIAKGTAFTISDEDKAGYTELSSYIKYIKELVESNEFAVDVNYSKDKISVSGNLQISVEKLKNLLAEKQEVNVQTLLKSISAKGDLTISSGSAKKKVSLILSDGTVYLNVDGIKVSLQIEELMKIFAKEESKDDTKSESFDLAKILNLDFGEYLTLSENGGELTLLIKGTELLQYFGKQFALGNVTLGISQKGITLSALDIDAEISKGTPFAISESEKEGYIELAPYIKSLVELLENDNFHAEIGYKAEEFTVSGVLDVSMAAIREQKEGSSEADLLDALRARAEITVTYKGITKTIKVSYVGRAVYLEIDHLKIKTDLPSAQEAVAASLGADEADEETVSLLEKLLALPYGDLVNLAIAGEGENAGMLSVVVHGTELLAELGYQYDLNDISLFLGEGEVKIEVLGCNLSLRGGEDFEIETDGYRDLTELAKKLVKIVKEQKISLTGELNLSYDKETISLIIEDSFLGWAGNTLKLDLKGKLVALGAEESFTLRVTEEEKGYVIKLSLENLGVMIDVSELGSLSDAFASLKTRVENVAEKIVGKDNTPHLSAIPGMENLAALDSSASGGKTLLDVLSGILEDFAIEDLLNGINFGDAEDKNALLALVYKDLRITLGEELAKDGMLVANLSYHKDGSKISVSGTLHADAEEREFPAESKTGLCYIEVKHFVSLLNQIEAAVGILDEKNLNYDVAGSVVTNGEQRYSVTGKISYALGGEDEVPFKLVEKKIQVAKGLSLVIRLDVVASGKTETGEKKDTSVYLDFWLLDYNTNKKTDGTLDFYVSASTVGRPEEGKDLTGYDPIKLYAPSTEIMGVLSGALSVLGMDDIDLLNKYFISQWLPSERAVKQFHALGDSLLSTLTQSLGEKIAPVKDILKKLGAFAEKQETETSAIAFMSATETERTGYIKDLTVTEDTFKLDLDTDLLYDKNGLEDLTVELARVKGESGNYVPSKFALSNIYNGAGTECTSLSFKTAENGLTELQPSDPENYTSFDGVDKLLVALVNSATHKVDESYAVNNNFYISGSASVKILQISDITLRNIGISVHIDENNEVGVDVHFEVNKKALVINDDTKTDLSIRGGMVYLRRVVGQETIYRVMPMATFTGDIMNQLKFALNIHRVAWAIIESQIKDHKPEETIETDVGTKLKEYISDFTYSNQNSQKFWTLSLNGKGLLGDNSFDDIIVKLGSDQDNHVRTLDIGMSIYTVLVTIDANLVWRNPAGVMDNNVTDNTANLRPFLENGMKKLLDRTVWNGSNYAEARGTKVSYNYNGDCLKTEDVVYESGSRKLLGELNPPDVTNLRPGYTGSWSLPETVSDNQSLTPQFQGKEYKIVFQSDREAKDYTFNKETNLWEKTLNWTYNDGTLPTLPLQEDKQMRMTGFKCPAGHVHTKENNGWHVYDSETIRLEAQWEDIVYTATFEIDGNIHTERGLYEEKIVYPEDPVKEGYTFEGWSETPDVYLEDYTITAQFVPNLYTVTFESALPVPEWEQINGKYTRTVDMYFGSSIEIEAGERKWNYTVKEDFTIELPSADEIKNGKLPGEWGEFEYQFNEVSHTSSASLTAKYTSKILVYHSDFTCTIIGCELDTDIYFKQDIVLKTPESAGEKYDFLGWYLIADDGTWQKITELKYDSCKAYTKVEALWYHKASVEFVGTPSRQKEGGNWLGIGAKYKYTATCKVTDGELIGAFAKEATVEITYSLIHKPLIGWESEVCKGEKVSDRTYFFNQQEGPKYDSIFARAEIVITYAPLGFKKSEKVDGTEARV